MCFTCLLIDKGIPSPKKLARVYADNLENIERSHEQDIIINIVIALRDSDYTEDGVEKYLGELNKHLNDIADQLESTRDIH